MVLPTEFLSGLIFPLPWSQCGYEKLPNHGVVSMTGRQKTEILQIHCHCPSYDSSYPSFVCLHEFFYSFIYWPNICKAYGMWSGPVVGLGNSWRITFRICPQEIGSLVETDDTSNWNAIWPVQWKRYFLRYWGIWRRTIEYRSVVLADELRAMKADSYLQHLF